MCRISVRPPVRRVAKCSNWNGGSDALYMCQWALQAACILNASHFSGNMGEVPVLVLVRQKGFPLVAVLDSGDVLGAGPETKYAGTLSEVIC